jgi:hypothetical protein
MAALRGLGSAPVEHDELTRRYFARGHLYTEYVARQLAARHGAENIEREVEIAWPLGVGHADVYVKPSRLLVEVKSTVTPTTSSPMFPMAVEQLRLYLRYHPEAERGALYLVNPSDLRGEDVFEVRLTDEDRDRIDATVAQVAEALEGDVGTSLPPRVCQRPSQGRGRLCPFIGPCFEGWTPPEPHKESDPAVLDVVRELAAIKAQERQHNEAIKALEEGKRDAQAVLADLLPEGETIVGNLKVTRTHVKRSPSFSVKAFEAAGHSVEPLAEFFRPGTEYDTFRIAHVDEAGEIDYGEVPF